MLACEISGISLLSALLIFSRVLPQALKEIYGLLSASASISRLYRRGVFAQHMKSRAKSDNLDRHFLAEVLVILGDVARIIEREVHHRRFVAVYLQDEAVWLLGSMGEIHFGNGVELRRLCRLLLAHLRFRRRRYQEQCCNRRRRASHFSESHHRVSSHPLTISRVARQRPVAICTPLQVSPAPRQSAK